MGEPLAPVNNTTALYSEALGVTADMDGNRASHTTPAEVLR